MIELILVIVFTLLTPIIAPALTLRLYEVNPEYFRKVKVRKWTFLFCGIGGKKSKYGDIHNYGIIVPLLVIQILGYFLTFLQIILIPILYTLVRKEYITLIVIGSIFAVFIFTSLIVCMLCVIKTKKRERLGQE